MAIQYSGTNYSSPFTCSVGTRQEIVTGLQTGLTAAGWSVISGSGTGNVLMQSATTPSPQSLAMRVNLFDPGSGNCARVIVRNTAGTHVQSNYLPLLPAAGKVFQIIANPYQCFIFTSSSPSTAREFAAWGVPYLPSFLQGVITECIWAMANGNSDTDTTVRPTFRTGLYAMSNSTSGALWFNCNGNIWEEFNTVPSGNYSGYPQLYCQQGAYLTSTSSSQMAYRWHDDSLLTYEPLLSWGLTAYTDEGKIRGQIWDAAIINDGFTADTTTSFDTHNWWNLTNTNTGSIGAAARGSLFLVTP
jgi:hypothetical protein